MAVKAQKHYQKPRGKRTRQGTNGRGGKGKKKYKGQGGPRKSVKLTHK